MTSVFSEESVRECVSCLMDTSDPDITFDRDGVCSWCRSYLVLAKEREKLRGGLHAQVERICRRARDNSYDCVVGISGGFDSTFLLLLAVRLGLRCLAVHFDSGWNSTIAVQNIKNLLDATGVELETLVCNWEVMADLQRAFLLAGATNCDAPQDHAFMAGLYQVARRRQISTVLVGSNPYSEWTLPRSWVGHPASDLAFLRACHRRFGKMPLCGYPTIHPFMLDVSGWFSHGLRRVNLLYHHDFSITEVTRELQSSVGWQPFWGKHHESIFTRFYQEYYLVRRFGFKKRRAHLSSLVTSGQMSRTEASALLHDPWYEREQLESDKRYVLKKLGFSEMELEQLVSLPRGASAPIHPRLSYLSLRAVAGSAYRWLRR